MEAAVAAAISVAHDVRGGQPKAAMEGPLNGCCMFVTPRLPGMPGGQKGVYMAAK